MKRVWESKKGEEEWLESGEMASRILDMVVDCQNLFLSKFLKITTIKKAGSNFVSLFFPVNILGLFE